METKMIWLNLKRLRRQVAVPCICLLTTVASVEHTLAQTDSVTQAAGKASVPDGWHVSTTSLRDFQMAFPGRPMSKTFQLGPFPMEVHFLEGDKGRYILNLMDISSDKRSPRTIETLKRQAGDFREQGFETSKLSEIQWRGRTVVEAFLESSDPAEKLCGRVRAFYSNDVVITALWIGPQKATPSNRDAIAFLESFSSPEDRSRNAASKMTAPSLASAPQQSSVKEAALPNQPGQKLTPELIQKLLNTQSDAEFLLDLQGIDTESADAETITFAIDLWVTAGELSDTVMIANAYSDAAMSSLGLHNAIDDPSVTNWSRRRMIRQFLAEYHNGHIRDLREVTTLEIRTKEIVSKLGATAAPQLASRQQWSMLGDIGDAAIDTLRAAAEDIDSPYRLASYFALRDRFEEAKVTPLPIDELMEMARLSAIQGRNHPYGEQAVEEIERLGYGSELIKEYVNKKLDPPPLKYKADFVEKSKTKIKSHEKSFRFWTEEDSPVQCGKTRSDLATVHHALLKYYIEKKDRENARKQFDLAKRAFEQAAEILSHETTNRFDRDDLPKYREINAREFGLFYQTCRMHDKAIEKFRKALQVDPYSDEASEAIAVSLIQTHQHRAAVQQYDDAIEREHDGYDQANHSRSYHYYRIAELYCRQLELVRQLGDPDEIQKVESLVLHYLSIRDRY